MQNTPRHYPGREHHLYLRAGRLHYVLPAMKSTARVFRGGAARQASKSLDGAKLPDPETVMEVPVVPPKSQLEVEMAEINKVPAPTAKKMDPNCFVVGEKVRYLNHVAGYNIALLEVQSLEDDFVIASRLLDRRKTHKFTRDGIATWSPNLSIRHTLLEP